MWLLQLQQAAIQPAPKGRRKIVLSTSIAETSLTIEGVKIVIDGGFSRVPKFIPRTGLTTLATIAVSKAAADQRRGRAGRTEPGVCYRLWDEPQTASLEPYAQPEILAADLSGFMTLKAGDLLLVGTADNPPRATAGQRIEVTMTGMARLTTRIERETRP